MPKYKLQVSVAADSVLPRDRLVNTFHVDDHGITSDPAKLALDTANIWKNSWMEGSAAREILVKVYEIGPAPQFPKAEAVLHKGVAATSAFPREIALCLSFYATRNLPRQRGRMYLPLAATTWSPGVRPTQTIRDRAIALGQAISGLGGADVDWIVWSKVAQAGLKVTNLWCDDEWDTVRRRGLKAVERTQAATSG